jgi:hypothetical protein
MDSWDFLRNVAHIGSPIAGTVTSRDEPDTPYEVPLGDLYVKTSLPYQALLPYAHLVDEPSDFSPAIIPDVGDSIRAVVFNFVDATLYLSSRPKDLKDTTIRKWRQYYDFIDTLTIGSEITGIVKRVMPFGLFVDIGSPFEGLIDIGHVGINGGRQLPRDLADWPKAGDKIECSVAYFRLHDQQVGLGWLPPKGADLADATKRKNAENSLRSGRNQE